jgi:hypothetical protein
MRLLQRSMRIVVPSLLRAAAERPLFPEKNPDETGLSSNSFSLNRLPITDR